MPRNDSYGKMSSASDAPSLDRVQPGRIMIVLREANVHDEVIYQIVMQCGEVRNIHRPTHNQQLVFVQYEEPSSAEKALFALKRIPIFKSVDPAYKAERFSQDKSGGGSKNYADDQQQNNTVGDSFSQQKGSFQGNGACTPLMDLRFNRNPALASGLLSTMNSCQDLPPINPELTRLLDIVVPPEYRQFINIPQHSMKQQSKKGKGQQRGSNNAGNQNGMNRSGRNDDLNNVSQSSMESGSPQLTVTKAGLHEPKHILGCWSCSKLPSFECRCGAFYCDVECQRVDWAIHKDICMPRLVPISYSNKCILEEARASRQSSAQSNDQSQPQQNQNIRRGQPNMPKNKKPNNQAAQQANMKSEVDQYKQSHSGQQQAQNQSPQSTANSSPADVPAPEEKVGRLINKIQRLKIARSLVGVTPRELLPGVFPREGSSVKITASLPTGIIYIYRNNSKEGGKHSEYYQLTTQMFQAASTAKPLVQKPSVGDVIFAPFLEGHFRAKVVSVDEENLEVFFVDFGNSDKVEWKQSREIADEDLKWAKYLTFPVMMEGVEKFTKEMLELLETLEHVEEFELVKAEPSSKFISVVLKRPRKSLTLNMELMELKEREIRLRKEREVQIERERLEKEQKDRESERQKEQEVRKQKGPKEVEVANPKNYQPVLFDESMETKELSPGEHKLLIIDASEALLTHVISVVAFDDMEKYASVLEHCNSTGSADPNAYKPVADGEVCLVVHENDWSRALWDASDATFMLLDVGIITAIAPSDVRRFPPGLGNVVYNNEVIVQNLDTLKQMMKDDETNSLHGKLINATISESEDGLAITIGSCV